MPNNKVIALINKALKGTLELTELYDNWPEELSGIDFFENVYDDIESAVEHLPGNILTGKPDLDKFSRTKYYYNLLIDFELLKQLSDFNIMNSIRNDLVSKKTPIKKISNTVYNKKIKY